MSEGLMWGLSALPVVLAIVGGILLFNPEKRDDNNTATNTKIGIVLLLLALILAGVLIYLDSKWKSDLRELAGSIEHFAYVPPNGDVGTAPEPVSKEAVEKAVAGLSPWVPWGLIQTLEGEEKKPTKDTDKFLEALAEESGKKVRYTRLPSPPP